VTVSVPAPRLPRWVPWAAGAAWLFLLAAAAALRTVGPEPGFWRTFFADVFATGASLGFALAGVATLLTRWEQRQQQVETAKITALEFNLAASAVRQLVEELLCVLASVVPLVRLAGPDNLAWLLRPPVDNNARELIRDTRLSSGFQDPPDKEFEAKFLDLLSRRPPRPKVAEDPGGWEEDCWFCAKQSTRLFAKIDDDDAALDRFVADGCPHLLSADALVARLGSLTESLQTPSLGSSRDLRRGVRHLVTTFEHHSMPGGALAPLMGTRETYHGRTGFGLGITALLVFLTDAVLPVCDALSATRRELAELLASDREEDLFGPLAEMERDDWVVKLHRQGAATVVAGTLAFEWDKHWKQVRATHALTSAEPEHPSESHSGPAAPNTT
jgi:hypothetical protein